MTPNLEKTNGDRLHKSILPLRTGESLQQDIQHLSTARLVPTLDVKLKIPLPQGDRRTGRLVVLRSFLIIS